MQLKVILLLNINFIILFNKDNFRYNELIILKKLKYFHSLTKLHLYLNNSENLK